MSTVLRIEVNRSSPVPLYHQVASQLEAAIADGRLPPGSSVENELSLAARLGISRPTARQAMQSLVEQGLVIRRRGVGTQVAPPRIRRPVELTSLWEDLRSSGRTPSTEVLDWRRVRATAELAALMEVEEGAELVTVQRLRSADGEPVALLTNWLPVALAPSAEELAGSGLYDCLRARGVQPRMAHQRIGARLATTAEARMLQEPARAALLTAERTAYDVSGAVIEHGAHLYRASRHLFDTTLWSS
ncbi:GntR family transcriptional regulator [Auraticoccus monumenti]|uniref:DNA-binding transcriptional regulator, GntR family n=1 Tax=Auraticoccus monumenti TaxID=675864 RepID=A0A1G7DE60_9ACTN|nr:GntR family transcriptional regulator [Auraticoccus monumenti]SDE49286.1 DNA-binding transcriptional regulator, GntR family [Auraticoccus monumenti]